MDETERAAQWGIRLKTLIKHKGWSARELARRSNLSATTAAEVVRGDAVKLSAKSQRLLAAALGWPDWDTMMASTELEPPAPAGADARRAEELALGRRLIEMGFALINGTGSGGTNANVNSWTGDTATDRYRTVQMAGTQHSARERTAQRRDEPSVPLPAAATLHPAWGVVPG